MFCESFGMFFSSAVSKTLQQNTGWNAGIKTSFQPDFLLTKHFLISFGQFKITAILFNERCNARACPQRFSSLASGGGIGKARTGAELPKSCEVSHEATPPLAPNCLLAAGRLCPLYVSINFQLNNFYTFKSVVVNYFYCHIM